MGNEAMLLCSRFFALYSEFKRYIPEKKRAPLNFAHF